MPTETKERRVAYLDGVRGIAAQIVVVHHFILGFSSGSRKLDAVFNGYTAVLIFFVLSGFVMSASSAKADLPLPFRSLTRYLRLALPMLPVAMIAWLLLILFPTASHDLGVLTSSAWSLGTYSAGPPPAWQMFTDAMVAPFISGSIYLNTSTGTMGPELIGSILVFILVRYCNLVWRPAVLVLVGAASLGVYGSWEFQRDALFCFAAGGLIWQFRAEVGRIPEYLSLPVAALSIPLLLLTAYGFSVRLGATYSFGPNGVVRLFAVSALIAAIVGSKHLRTFFGGRFPVFLGRISFGVYLVHQPLESTLFASLYTMLRPSGFGLSLLFLGFTVTSFIGGWVVTIAVDEPVVRVLKDWSKRVSAHGRIRLHQEPSPSKPSEPATQPHVFQINLEAGRVR